VHFCLPSFRFYDSTARAGATKTLRLELSRLKFLNFNFLRFHKHETSEAWGLATVGRESFRPQPNVYLLVQPPALSVMHCELLLFMLFCGCAFMAWNILKISWVPRREWALKTHKRGERNFFQLRFSAVACFGGQIERLPGSERWRRRVGRWNWSELRVRQKFGMRKILNLRKIFFTCECFPFPLSEQVGKI
jgi:hypothetical protein